jgi:poly-gamma-glutamate capsule biosynthesis protein CapA/YwtB (metallophosphatase superfamily)
MKFLIAFFLILLAPAAPGFAEEVAVPPLTIQVPTAQSTPEPEPSTVTIVAVGDMMLGNWAEDLLDREGIDYPFTQVGEILRKADIATGNLEGPHCTQGEAMKKTYTFRMPIRFLDAYKNAGFDVVAVSNNHAMDFGSACFLECLSELQKREIKVCGGGKNLAEANRAAVIERNGIKTAFLGYSLTYPKEAWAAPGKPGTVFAERNRLIRAVELASEENDLVVVQFHWGGEGKQDLRDYQSDLARLAIDHGADLIIGHHPHILQGIESYKGKLIFYSLGNFTFASYSKRARTSAIAKVTLDKSGKLVTAEAIPVNVYNYEVHLQPKPIPGDPAILEELRTTSMKIGRGAILPVIEPSGEIRIAE